MEPLLWALLAPYLCRCEGLFLFSMAWVALCV